MAWRSTIKSFGTVIVTGGSSGIGAAFIRTVRKLDGIGLICNLSRDFCGKTGVKSGLPHRPTDLTQEAEVKAAAEWVNACIDEGRDGPILLINNAGFGHYGAFGTEGHSDLEMIDLNVRAVVDLTGRLLPRLRQRGGWILNVASIAGFQPVPYMATYAATKAFVLHWSLALDEELRGSGVRALAVCPGPTESQFFRRAGFPRPPGATRGQTAEAVVEEALQALHRGRGMVVTGWTHRWVTRFMRLLSRPAQARLGRITMERLRLSQLQQKSE